MKATGKDDPRDQQGPAGGSGGFRAASGPTAAVGLGSLSRRGRGDGAAHAAEADLRALSMRQQALLAAIPDIVMEVDTRRVYTWANEPGLAFFGEDVVGREAAFYFEGEQQTYEAVEPLFAGGDQVIYVESWQRRQDGEKRLLAWWCRVLKDDRGNVTGAISSARDITEQKRAQDALRASEEQFRALSANLAEGMVYQINSGLDGSRRRFTYVSPAVERLHGLTADAVMRDPALLYGQVIEGDRARLAEQEARAYADRSVLEADVRVRLASGDVRWRRFRSAPRRLPDGSVVWDGIEMDITESKQAESERERLQAQLTQARKMESIGRLAGGVAHDFNNLLQAILGNASMAREVLPPDSPALENLDEIQKSSERSAELTRQLLAFARKQAIAPKVLDVNGTVAALLRMLRRLIGEGIELVWIPGAGVWPVRMDPGQVDQVLTNLCLNARDAIGGTGKVAIRTENVNLDDDCAAGQPDAVPGDYVVLAVSDNGVGMDAATQAHLFEPFFTTKAAGKGTGLGLATVFGIVKQNHGLINVTSEPGRGTTFRIYLPRADTAVAATEPEGAGPLLDGTETVLIVEDEEQILKLTQLFLQHRGYKVLTAGSAETALSLVTEPHRPIDLLITDVVLPGMNGKELRDRLWSSHPGLRCLFMSGYTADVIAHHGVLDAGVDFLAKPFTNQALAQKVREVLNRGVVP